MYNIELDCEVGSKLVAAMLQDDLTMLENDLRKLKDGHAIFHNFSSNEQTEKKELKKHIKALRIILEYYGVVEPAKPKQPILPYESIYEEVDRDLPA